MIVSKEEDDNNVEGAPDSASSDKEMKDEEA
jgi:hypothetical protein